MRLIMRRLLTCICIIIWGCSIDALDVRPAPFTAAAVQFNPQFMQLDENISAISKLAERAAQNGAKLIVFPEMSTCGYIYKDRAQIDPFLDTIPGKTTQMLEKVSRQYGAYIVVGIGEIDAATGMGFNAAALIGPKGYIGKYRKVGLNSSDQIWVSPGNLGHPVFPTEIGNISLLICYDDVYFETSRLSALKGADIIAYAVSSDRALKNEPSSINNHSTIANVQYMAAWNGVYLICADRSNTETNPQSGLVVHYNGASSIWNSLGKKIAQLPYTDVDSLDEDEPLILYAQIDPNMYRNPIKDLMKRRRPELYRDLTLFRAPTDPRASTKSASIASIAVQYAPIFGDKSANFNKIRTLLKKRSEILTKWNLRQPNLIVLPAYSLTGYSPDPKMMQLQAETIEGNIVSDCMELAVEYGSYLVLSFLEKEYNYYFHTALLLSPQGEIIGKYRQTHLDESLSTWMKTGNEISVFSTSIGRIGLMLESDVLFPEIAGVHSVNRADVIAIPTQWNGSYGNTIEIDPQLFVKPFPPNTMIYWYAIAKCAQSYVIVANYVNSERGYKGSSGVYSLNPVMGHYPPMLASEDREEAYYSSFKTLGDPDWWMDQEKLITGRRADLAVPMVLPTAKKAFNLWKNSPGFNTSIWAQQ